jgi:hypothetical protein
MKAPNFTPDLSKTASKSLPGRDLVSVSPDHPTSHKVLKVFKGTQGSQGSQDNQGK